jgi:hypothetical protein
LNFDALRVARTKENKGQMTQSRSMKLLRNDGGRKKVGWFALSCPRLSFIFWSSSHDTASTASVHTWPLLSLSYETRKCLLLSRIGIHWIKMEHVT